MAALDLREVLDAVGRGDRDVDRLPRRLGERGHRALGRLDEQPRGEPAAGVAGDDRTGAERAPQPLLLDQPVALQRAEQARGGGLRQARIRGELAERARGLGREHEREELRAAIDHLRARA